MKESELLLNNTYNPEVIEYDEWSDTYEPYVIEKDIKYFETYGDDLVLLKAIKPNHIWTLLDDSKGGVVLVSGSHYVNRIHYLVTKFPWEKEILINVPCYN